MKLHTVFGVMSVIVIALIMFIDLSDLFSYITDPRAYHFGTEVSGFRYRSAGHFIGSIIATVALGAMALVAPWATESPWISTGFRIGTAVAMTLVGVLSSK